MDNKLRISKYLDQKELAAFLRDVAEAMDNGGADEFSCVETFTKLKIEAKNEFGTIKLKARITAEDPCIPLEAEAPGEPGKPKYKALKKRMRSSFKLLLKTIHDGQVPPAEAMESFLEDSALMVTYPGYGDEFYASYTQACEALKAAYDAGDIEGLHTAIDVLIHEKSRCHAKYD